MSIKTTKPVVICLTPIKNEAWILDRFLSCASLWADYIIIADQNSDDGSAEVAKKYNKVIYVHNPPEKYFNEYSMRSILFDEARKIPGKRLLVAVDADEALSANVLNSAEWKTILNSEPGTIVQFQLINIRPDLESCWKVISNSPRGFMDDGSEYVADRIHTNHVPLPHSAPKIICNEIKLLHFQYVDWNRMESKHRWYQCWERINNPTRSSIEIFRQYHHMYMLKSFEIRKLDADWFLAYQDKGVDMTSIYKEGSYWWDKVVLKYIDEFGAAYFQKEAIWGTSWVEKARIYGYKDLEKFRDPRSIIMKLLGRYRKRTLLYYDNFFIKRIDKILKYLFKW